MGTLGNLRVKASALGVLLCFKIHHILKEQTRQNAY